MLSTGDSGIKNQNLNNIPEFGTIDNPVLEAFDSKE